MKSEQKETAERRLFFLSGSLPQLGMGEIMRQDLLAGRPLLCQCLGAPLAQPYAVAIALGGDREKLVRAEEETEAQPAEQTETPVLKGIFDWLNTSL